MQVSKRFYTEHRHLKSFLKPAAESSLESHRTHMPTDSQKDIFPEGKTSHLYNDREQALAFIARIHKIMEDDYDVHEERRRAHERRKGRNHSPTSNADGELKYTLDPINSARKSRNITPRMKKHGSGYSQGRPRLDSQFNSLTNTNRDTYKHNHRENTPVKIMIADESHSEKLEHEDIEEKIQNCSLVSITKDGIENYQLVELEENDSCSDKELMESLEEFNCDQDLQDLHCSLQNPVFKLTDSTTPAPYQNFQSLNHSSKSFLSKAQNLVSSSKSKFSNSQKSVAAQLLNLSSVYNSHRHEYSVSAAQIPPADPKLISLQAVFQDFTGMLHRRCKEQGEFLAELWEVYYQQYGEGVREVMDKCEQRVKDMDEVLGRIKAAARKVVVKLDRKHAKLCSVFSELAHVKTVLKNAVQLYKKEKIEKEEIFDNYQNYRAKVDLFFPNFKEFMNEEGITNVLLNKPQNFAQSVKYEPNQGYDKMSLPEKMYLYDLEFLVDNFPKRTSYEIREEDHRRSFLESERKIRKFNVAIREKNEEIEKLTEHCDRQKQLLDKHSETVKSIEHAYDLKIQTLSNKIISLQSLINLPKEPKCISVNTLPPTKRTKSTHSKYDPNTSSATLKTTTVFSTSKSPFDPCTQIISSLLSHIDLLSLEISSPKFTAQECLEFTYKFMESKRRLNGNRCEAAYADMQAHLGYFLEQQCGYTESVMEYGESMLKAIKRYEATDARLALF